MYALITLHQWLQEQLSHAEPLTSLDITSRTATTISLSWTYLSDESTRIGLQIEVMKGEGLVGNITLPASAINTTLSSLEPRTMYIIAVYVVNANNKSRPIFIQASTVSKSKSVS